MPELKSPFAGVLSEEDAVNLARVLKALAHPNRLRLVSLLAAKGTATNVVLWGEMRLTQPTVSAHLQRLANAGLLRRDKVGSFVHTWLAEDVFAELAGLLRPGRRR